MQKSIKYIFLTLILTFSFAYCSEESDIADIISGTNKNMEKHKAQTRDFSHDKYTDNEKLKDVNEKILQPEDKDKHNRDTSSLINDAKKAKDTNTQEQNPGEDNGSKFIKEARHGANKSNIALEELAKDIEKIERKTNETAQSNANRINIPKQPKQDNSENFAQKVRFWT